MRISIPRHALFGLLAIVLALLSSIAPERAAANPISTPFSSPPGPPVPDFEDGVTAARLQDLLDSGVLEDRLTALDGESRQKVLEWLFAAKNGASTIPSPLNPIVDADFSRPEPAPDGDPDPAASRSRGRMLGLSAISLAAVAGILACRHLRRRRAGCAS